MEARQSDTTIRTALWSSVGLNALGVAVFAPVALGFGSALLPIKAPPFFAAQIGLTIALFGGVYAWLAMQPTISRELLVVGGIGKLGFFGITAAYALAGVVPVKMAVQATPDLLLGTIFLWWALGSRSSATP